MQLENGLKWRECQLCIPLEVQVSEKKFQAEYFERNNGGVCLRACTARMETSQDWVMGADGVSRNRHSSALISSAGLSKLCMSETQLHPRVKSFLWISCTSVRLSDVLFLNQCVCQSSGTINTSVTREKAEIPADLQKMNKCNSHRTCCCSTWTKAH